jgi:cytochrome c peroxidase
VHYTDGAFHDTGVGWNAATQTFADDGRYAVTHALADRGAFKTPTLRDVSRHPPYMHDGSMATLLEVVRFYRAGGIANPGLDPRLSPISPNDLTDAQLGQLVAFLEALAGTGYEDTAPAAFPE